MHVTTPGRSATGSRPNEPQRNSAPSPLKPRLTRCLERSRETWTRSTPPSVPSRTSSAVGELRRWSNSRAAWVPRCGKGGEGQLCVCGRRFPAFISPRLKLGVFGDGEIHAAADHMSPLFILYVSQSANQQITLHRVSRSRHVLQASPSETSHLHERKGDSRKPRVSRTSVVYFFESLSDGG